MGVADRPDMGTRRAVALGLAAGAFAAPSLLRAQEVITQVPAATTLPLKPADAPATGFGVPASLDLSDRMTVPVRVNGFGPFPFVVDTGSNRSVVSDVLANQLNLPMTEVLKVHSATGIVSTGSVHVETLSVGARKLTSITAPVLQAEHLGALGMLGIDAVADQRIVLDFKRHEMQLTPGRRADEDPGSIVVRARSKYGQLLLVDSWVEGIPLYVIIDTGGEITIGNSAMRNTLARRRRAYPEPIMVTSVTGDSVKADLGYIPRLRLGNIGVNGLQIAYADMYAFEEFGLQNKPSMLLGMSTLRSFQKVSIDFPAREVRFMFDGA